MEAEGPCRSREILSRFFPLQVDRFNPDNTPNLPEAELMAKAGEIAKQAGFLSQTYLSL